MRQIYKYRILLITLASVAFFSMSGYSVTKGMVYNVSIPESYEYSEEVNFSSDALFSTVTYNFREKGDTTWVADLPVTAGEYQVEIQTKQVFGGVKSSVRDFTISPVNIVLELEESNVVFGNEPVIKTQLVEGDFIESVVYSYDDVSLSTTTVTVESMIIKDSLGNDVSNSYNFEVGELPITFTPRQITVSLLDISDIYKGVTLTSEEIEITSGSLLDGQNIEVTSSGSQLHVGNSLNTILTTKIWSDDVDVSLNYAVTYQDGSLEVTQRPLTIETIDNNKIYDDSPLSNINYDILEGALIPGHIINITNYTDRTLVGVSDNVLSMEIVDPTGLDVTNNYNITYIYGQLEVMLRQITITTASDYKVYDDTKLSNNEYTITQGSLTNGQSINVQSAVELTDVGSIDNALSIEIFDADGFDVSNNFDITYIFGQIEIVVKPITIQTESDTLVYDGTAFSNNNYSIIEGSLVIGHSVNLITNTSTINVGIIDNIISIQIFDTNSIDVTKNYDLTYVYGTIEVTQKQISIKPADAVKIYDGVQLVEDTVEITDGLLVSGHLISITTSGSQLNVGSSNNTILSTLIFNQGIDVSSNYDVTYQNGLLQISKRVITFKLENVEKIYDETKITSNTVTIVNGELVSGHTINVTALGEQKNAGISINTLQNIQVMNGLNDVSNNYEITYQDGLLEVTTRTITIKPLDIEKVYDGTTLISNEAESIGALDLVDGHSITITTSGSRINVGSTVSSILTASITKDGVDVTSNYTIVNSNGLLYITQRPITIKAIDATKVYDGIILQSEVVELVDNILQYSLVDGHTLNTSTLGSQLNVGSSLNTIKSTVIMNDGDDVTYNYLITKQTGALEITPREISIKPIDASKVYDATNLTSDDVEMVEGTILSGHVIAITTSGSQLNVDTSLNPISSTVIMDGGIDVTSNYEVTVLDGILEITPRNISIKLVDVSRVYDGTNLTTNEVFSLVASDLIAGHVIAVNSFGSQLNVGSSINAILTASIQQNGIDFTDNYNITFLDGLLEVTPRPITIQPLNRIEIYDGLPLVSNEAIDIYESLVNNQNIEITTSGSQLNVGSSVNTILTAIIIEDTIDVSYNYDITYLDGSLEVTPRPITILTATETRIYDGTSLSNLNYGFAAGSLALGQTIEVITHTDIINVGVINNELSIEILDSEDTNVSSNYEIAYQYGQLEITPRPITIQTATDTKVYDGTVLSNVNYVITEGTLANAQSINVTSHPEVLNVGTIDNNLTIEILDSVYGTVSSNYDITYLYGPLEVTPRPLTIQSVSDSTIYDGVTLFNLNYSITEGTLVLGHSIDIITYAEIENVGVVDNVLSIEILDVLNVNQIGNYDITEIDGQLEVTPRLITIQTEAESKVYDGTILSNLNYSMTIGDLPIGQTLYLVSNPVIINVDVIYNDLTFEILDSENIDVIDNYDITYIYGQLEVTPRQMTIQTDSETNVYNGMPVSNLNYVITVGSVAIGQMIDVISNAEITNVGVIDNDLTFEILDSEDVDVISNYDITYLTGQLEVTIRSITIQTSSDSKIYDGTPLSSLDYLITVGSISMVQTVEIISNASITNVGILENNIGFEILDSEGVNVISNYDITYLYGQLEVTLRSITLHVIDVIEIYNGEILISNEVESIGTLDVVSGQTVTAATTGSQLNVGSSLNTISTVQILDVDSDVTSNYDITYLEGSLEVTPRPITIQSQNDSKVYDGTPLSNLNYSIIAGSLVPLQSINIISNNDLTIVDVIDNVLTMDILTSDNDIVTSNYEITYDYGFLEVTPRTIIISTSSATKEYDGTPLTSIEWELSSGTMIVDQQLNITVTGTITEVGKEFNSFTYEILDSDLNDVTMYYIIVDNSGILEVERVKILLVIETGSDSKAYDGTPLTNDEWVLVEGEVLSNHTLDITLTGSITEVGFIDNDFTYIVVDEFGTDITADYYFVQSTLGILTILEADDNGTNSESAIPISSEGDLDTLFDSTGVVLEVYSEIDDTVYLRDKSYGDYLKTGWGIPVVYDSPFGVTPFEFPALVNNNIQIAYQLQVKAIRSGLSYYVPYYSTNGFYGNTNDIYVDHAYSDGYTIDYIPTETLDYETVTLQDQTQINNELIYRQFVYDTYLQIPRETEEALLQIAAANGLDSNNASIISDVQSYIKNAAVYNLAYKPIPDNVDYALYFLEVSHEGICQHFATAGVVMYRAMGIPARYVTGYVAYTTANEWSEVTTNQAHAWVEVYIDGFGWVPVEVTASIGGDGSGTGTGTGSVPGDTPANEDLQQITIISSNASKQYDGTPLTKENYYHTGTLASGHTLTVDVNGTISLVGETSNVFTYTILDIFGNDVSGLYNVETNYGLLVVVPNNDLEILEFQVYDLTAVYSGEYIQHGDIDYWMPSNNLPSNYTVYFDIIGEIKDVGRIETYIDETSIVILDENLMDVTNEYNIICYLGSIEVLERSITISSFSAQKAYDGLPLTSDIFYISQGELALGDEILVDITGSITEVGLAANDVASVLVTNANGDDVSSNYNVTIVEGTLVVESE